MKERKCDKCMYYVKETTYCQKFSHDIGETSNWDCLAFSENKTSEEVNMQDCTNCIHHNKVTGLCRLKDRYTFSTCDKFADVNAEPSEITDIKQMIKNLEDRIEALQEHLEVERRRLDVLERLNFSED